MALRSILRVGALASLWCGGVDSLRCASEAKATVAFASAACSTSSPSRKRPRGSRTALAAGPAWTRGMLLARSESVAVQTAVASGSFVARSQGARAWSGEGGMGKRCAGLSRGGGVTMLGIEFHPAPTSELIHALGQAVVFGILGGVIPKWTKDRVREKEAGLERDERYEMGLDMDEEDEYGYAEGFVCGTCNNENEVECSQCGGKGFFVNELARPRKCGNCGGLGTLECPECEERREMLRQERARRNPPLRLPPSRDDDFTLGR